MPQTNLTKGKKAVEDLAGDILALPDDLPFELILRPTNKTTKLVANSGHNSHLKSQHRWYDFEFSEFVFLNRIEVLVTGFSSYQDFEIKYVTVDRNEVSVNRIVAENVVIQPINSAINSISFRPPVSWLVEKFIVSVKLIGLTQSNVENFLSTVEKIDAYQQTALSIMEEAVENAQSENDRYVQLQAQLTSTNSEIAKSKTDVSTKKAEITKLTEKINTLRTDQANNQNSLITSSESLNRVNSEIENQTSVRNSLSAEITERTSELKSLKENINMFPSEISGFVGQGTSTMWIYVGLSAIPVLIILIMFIVLIWGAADLTTVLEENPGSSIYAIFLTRIPYVSIAGMIIAASYKICRVLLEEVIRINRQKLNLTKVSIIAKDVSFASENELGLDDEQKYQLRTKLKMDLLRDHLKDYLSKDFSIALPSSINSLGAYFFGSGNKREEESAPENSNNPNS
jgi:hypothetical protein